MIRHILIIAFTLVSQHLFSIEVPGYYINNEKDTVQTSFIVPDKLERGQYAIGGGYLKIQKEIISLENGIEKKLTPKDIIEYNFQMDGFQIRMISEYSLIYTLGDVFKRVLFEGKHVKVVGEYIRFTGSLNGGGNATGVKYKVYIKQKDNTSKSHSEYTDMDWGKRALKEIFEDCPKVVSKIDAKIFKREQIGKIAEEYEDCLESASNIDEPTENTDKTE